MLSVTLFIPVRTRSDTLKTVYEQNYPLPQFLIDV